MPLPIRSLTEVVQAFLADCRQATGGILVGIDLYPAYVAWCACEGCDPSSPSAFAEIQAALSARDGVRTTSRTRLSPSDKLALLEAQDHTCPLCHREILETDRKTDEHLRALGLGGLNAFGNRAIVHRACAEEKTGGPEGDQASVATAKRVKRKAFGFETPRRPMPGGIGSPDKRKIGGGVVDRVTGEPRVRGAL